ELTMIVRDLHLDVSAARVGDGVDERFPPDGVGLRANQRVELPRPSFDDRRERRRSVSRGLFRHSLEGGRQVDDAFIGAAGSDAIPGLRQDLVRTIEGLLDGLAGGPGRGGLARRGAGRADAALSALRERAPPAASWRL